MSIVEEVPITLDSCGGQKKDADVKMTSALILTAWRRRGSALWTLGQGELMRFGWVYELSVPVGVRRSRD